MDSVVTVSPVSMSFFFSLSLFPSEQLHKIDQSKTISTLLGENIDQTVVLGSVLAHCSRGLVGGLCCELGFLGGWFCLGHHECHSFNVCILVATTVNLPWK